MDKVFKALADASRRELLDRLRTENGQTLGQLCANLDDKGNLDVLGFGTRDIRPGFRYVLGIVSREGVKTVNKKDLPKE